MRRSRRPFALLTEEAEGASKQLGQSQPKHFCSGSQILLEPDEAHPVSARSPGRARAHSPPSAAALKRCPAPSCNSCTLRPLARRASRGCRGHAHHPLDAHAPRPGASASPGTADGRSHGALKRRPGSLLASG
eukprot:6653487-Prymnesium_polylepis.1